jgi:hypothetical protein
MKVKDLIELLAEIDPEHEVMIYDNGSILNTGDAQDSLEYNAECETTEFFIVAEEWAE